jgi:RNase P subunit RPR2
LIYDFGHNNFSVGLVMQERKQFVVTCKDCQRAIPTGAKEFPFHSMEVTCPLCGEKHRYLPSEFILGKPNELAAKKQRGVTLFGITVLRVPINQAQTNPERSGSGADRSGTA